MLSRCLRASIAAFHFLVFVLLLASCGNISLPQTASNSPAKEEQPVEVTVTSSDDSVSDDTLPAQSQQSASMPTVTIEPTPTLPPIPTDARLFEETGNHIFGAIEQYWEAGGGVATYGYPITEQQYRQIEGERLLVQWFERTRMELHPDGNVTTGRLGVELLELQGRPWQSFPTPTETEQPDCGYVPETKHLICEPFLSYWQENGGVEHLGYPITEEIVDKLESSTGTWVGNVQYFERCRLELHNDIAGSPVLMGMIGREVLALAGE